MIFMWSFLFWFLLYFDIIFEIGECNIKISDSIWDEMIDDIDMVF